MNTLHFSQVLVSILEPNKEPIVTSLGPFVRILILLLRYVDMLLIAKQGTRDDDKPTADECLICLETRDRMIVLSCAHSLCSECAKHWVDRKRNCPFCRQGFSRRHVRKIQWELLEWEAQKVQGDLDQLHESISTAIGNLPETSSNFLDAYVSKGCAPIHEEDRDDFVLLG